MAAAQLIEILIKALQLYIVLLFIRIIASWFTAGRYGYNQPKALEILYNITEPVMAPMRRLIPPIGGLDLSPILLFFLLNLLISFLRNIQYNMMVGT